jgi:hypothetical protein
VNGERRFVGELKYAKYFIETQDDEGILWTDEEPKTKNPHKIVGEIGETESEETFRRLR